MTTSLKTQGPAVHIPCPQCGRPATPGKFCAGCGTRVVELPLQVPDAGPAGAGGGAPSRGWLPAAIAAGVAVAIGAVVAIVLIVVGGAPAESTGAKTAKAVSVNAVRLSASNLYAPIDGPRVRSIVPAGWTRHEPRIDGIADGLTAVSAQDKDASVTLGFMTVDESSLSAQARTLRSTRKAQSGYDEQSFGRLTLAGSRPAWKLLYARDGTTTVEYVTKACDGFLVVSGTAPDKIFGTLENRFGVIARSTQAVC